MCYVLHLLFKVAGERYSRVRWPSDRKGQTKAPLNIFWSGGHRQPSLVWWDKSDARKGDWLSRHRDPVTFVAQVWRTLDKLGILVLKQIGKTKASTPLDLQYARRSRSPMWLSISSLLWQSRVFYCDPTDPVMLLNHKSIKSRRIYD